MMLNTQIHVVSLSIKISHIKKKNFEQWQLVKLIKSFNYLSSLFLYEHTACTSWNAHKFSCSIHTYLYIWVIFKIKELSTGNVRSSRLTFEECTISRRNRALNINTNQMLNMMTWIHKQLFEMWCLLIMPIDGMEKAWSKNSCIFQPRIQMMLWDSLCMAL